jgi:iron complex outermembrane receptor protein
MISFQQAVRSRTTEASNCYGKLTAITLLALSTTSISLPAMAQDSTDAVEEIVVTADRRNSFGADYMQAGTFRDARIIDTPLTITVLPREVLDAQQASSVFDAVRNTAGVSQAQINTLIYSNLAIRGIQVDNLTNYRLNGVLPAINFVDLPIENKDRVEVLKGAAGLYYGFATPSGIVNLVSKRPLDKPLTVVEINGDSRGGFGGTVDLSRPLSPTLGLRLNAGASRIETGIDRTRGDRKFASAALDWQASERLRVELDADYSAKTVTEPTEFVLPAAVNGQIALPSLQSASHNLGASWMEADGWTSNLLGRARYSLSDNWRASVSIGQSYLKRDRIYSSFSGYDLATGNGTVNVATTHGNDYRSTIYRGDVTGDFDTGPLHHQLMFGASQNVRKINIPTAVRYSFAQNLYNPVVIPEQPTPPRIIANPSTVKDTGAFIFDRISYQDWLEASIGFRKANYSDISRTSRYKDKPDTWSYGLLLKPWEGVSLYGNYIEGLESGGIAQQIARNAGEVLPASLSKQYEAGVKLEPVRGLLLTAAYFDIDRAAAYINSAGYYVQDGRASYRGVEFSASGEIGEDISLTLSGTVLDAEQESGAATVIGKRIENTAKFSGSVFAEYRLPVLPELRLSAGMFHVGRRPVNALNQAYVASYTTFDLGARYDLTLGGRDVTLRVYGENVTGRRYWAATGSGLLAQAAPARVKFSVSTQL